MQVSPLCLGAMMFGAWGEPDHDTSIKIIHRALDAGINFIDTADVYSQGESEVIVGKALAGGRRDDVILATKAHGQMGVPVDAPVGTKGDPNKQGNSRRWIVREVEDSLRRLNTDWIDLYQIHRPDPDTSDEETLSVLTDLQRQGKIRAFGSSTYPAQHIVEAQWTAEKRGLGRFRDRAAAVFDPGPRHRGGRAADLREVRHGRDPVEPAGRRLAEREVPQGRGRARSRTAQADAGPVRPVGARQPAQTGGGRRAGKLADEAGIPLVHLAIAFVLQHPAVTAPIIGPRTMDQLESQLGAVDVTLTPDILDRIDEIVPPGVTMNDSDRGYRPPALTDPFQRRRRTA